MPFKFLHGNDKRIIGQSPRAIWKKFLLSVSKFTVPHFQQPFPIYFLLHPWVPQSYFVVLFLYGNFLSFDFGLENIQGMGLILNKQQM